MAIKTTSATTSQKVNKKTPFKKLWAVVVNIKNKFDGRKKVNNISLKKGIWPFQQKI